MYVDENGDEVQGYLTGYRDPETGKLEYYKAGEQRMRYATDEELHDMVRKFVPLENPDGGTNYEAQNTNPEGGNTKYEVRSTNPTEGSTNYEVRGTNSSDGPLDTGRSTLDTLHSSLDTPNTSTLDDINSLDNQGNPVDGNGRLVVEKVESVADLSDDDFQSPTRTVELPKLSDKVALAIGAGNRPVIIKKNIFERNKEKHPDITAGDSRMILDAALYSPDLYGQTQPSRQPYKYVLVNIPQGGGKYRHVLLEVEPTKENIEIVHWYYLDKKGLEKLKKQAEREDGQLLILPSETEEVGALSDPTDGLLSGGKDSDNIADTQISAQESDAMPMMDVKRKGETVRRPDWMTAGVERSHRHIYGEKGLEKTEADAFVEGRIKASEKAVSDWEKKRPDASKYDDPDDYLEAKGQWEAERKAKQGELDLWLGIRDTETQRVNAQRAAEDAARQTLEAPLDLEASQYKRDLAMAESEVDGPQDAYQYVTMCLAGVGRRRGKTGDVRGTAITYDSLVKELGEGVANEVRKRVRPGTIATRENGGVSIEQLADNIYEELPEQFRAEVHDDPYYIRNMIIDALRSGDVGRAYAEQQASNKEAARQRVIDEYDEYAQEEKGHDDFQEYLDYEYQHIDQMIENNRDYDEDWYNDWRMRLEEEEKNRNFAEVNTKYEVRNTNPEEGNTKYEVRNTKPGDGSLDTLETRNTKHETPDPLDTGHSSLDTPNPQHLTPNTSNQYGTETSDESAGESAGDGRGGDVLPSARTAERAGMGAVEGRHPRAEAGDSVESDAPQGILGEEARTAEDSLNTQPSTLNTLIDAASAEVDTEPTDAQKEAGNYKKGHVKVADLDITIENPKGSTRSGVDAHGKAWSIEMKHTYGYIRGTKGKDGDHIDVYLADDMDAWDGNDVYVVDQTNPDGSFDEHKVMMGFHDNGAAWEAYYESYSPEWWEARKGAIPKITRCPISEFNDWLSVKTKKSKPFADYGWVDDMQKAVRSEATEATEAQRRVAQALIDIMGEAGHEVHTRKDMAEVLKDMAEPVQRQAHVEETSKRYQEQLDLFADGKMASNEAFSLGTPSAILLSAGIPQKEIRMTQSVLRKHLEKHGLSVDDVRGLVEDIQNPLMVYEWGSKSPAHVVITDIRVANGDRITVAIRMDKDGNVHEVNEVASVHGKSIERLLKEMATENSDFFKDNLKYVDKEKALAWLTQPSPKEGSSSKQGPDISLDEAAQPSPKEGSSSTQVFDVAKVIKDFENPKITPAILEQMTVGESFGGKSKAGTEFLKTRDGEVYGFVKDDEMYIDETIMDPNVAIHEYTHLWDKAVRTANPELWQRGKELMRELPLWNEVVSDPAYKDIAHDEDLVASEVHSRLTGKDYYVRFTVQSQKDGSSGTHAMFVTDVELYENPTESRTIPLTLRGTTDFNGIVDAKLRNFFMLASGDEKTFAQRLKYATGWERGADGEWRYEVADFEVDATGMARRGKLWSQLPWGKARSCG